MIKYYLKKSLREMANNKYLTILKILGLSIGLTFAIVLGYNILFERNIDTFQKDYQNKYRFRSSMKFGDSEVSFSIPGSKFKDAIDKHSEIEAGMMMNIVTSKDAFLLNETNRQSLEEFKILQVSNSFLDFVELDIIQGSPSFSEIERPIIISKSAAKKLFGKTDVVGKELDLEYSDEKHQYTISALMKDMPSNSNFQADILMSFGLNDSQYFGFGNLYFQFTEGVDIELMKKDLALHFQTGGSANTTIVNLSNISQTRSSEKSQRKLYIYFSLIVLILLISIVNYVLMQTIQLIQKLKDKGIQFVCGASKYQILKEYTISSALSIIISLFLSVIFVFVLNSQLSDLFGIRYNARFNISIILIFILAVVFIVLFIIVLSQYLLIKNKTVLRMLAGANGRGKKYQFAFNSLIFVQIFSFLSLFSFTCIISMQLSHFKSSKIGFEQEGLMYVNLFDANAAKSFDLKNRLKSRSEIKSLSIANSLPFCSKGVVSFVKKDKDGKGFDFLELVSCDNDYFKTLESPFVEGNDFETDQLKFVVNQSFYDQFGLSSSPISNFELDSIDCVGIVNDYYTMHMSNGPTKMVFVNNANQDSEKRYGYNLIIRFMDSPASIISKVRDEFEDLFPEMDFEYDFVDNQLKQVYKEEIRFGKIINWMTFFSILIACLGLLGISYFKALIRQKEIGIRKVNGATTHEILNLFNRQYVWQFILAFALSIPLVIYIGNWWLEGFSSHVDIEIWVFILTFIVAGLIVFGTISLHAYRAARRNPVKSLRYE